MRTPVGRSSDKAAASRYAQSEAYRQARAQTHAASQLAKSVIQKRTVLNMSVARLAKLAAVEVAVVNSIENAQSDVPTASVQKVRRALGLKRE